MLRTLFYIWNTLTGLFNRHCWHLVVNNWMYSINCHYRQEQFCSHYFSSFSYILQRSPACLGSRKQRFLVSNLSNMASIKFKLCICLFIYYYLTLSLASFKTSNVQISPVGNQNRHGWHLACVKPSVELKIYYWCSLCPRSFHTI